MSKSLLDFERRERSAPDWIIPGILKRGNTAFMIGPPKKSCKSWLMLAMAWDLSEGRPVWGVQRADGRPLFTPPRAMRTVYFTQEDTEDDIHDRLYAYFGLGLPTNDRLWVVPKNWNLKLDNDSGKRAIQEELDQVRRDAGPIDLVIFDPMRRLHNGEENDSGAISQIWQVLDRVHQRYACSTLFTHHTRKPPQDKSNYDPTDPFVARGSGDIYGGGDGFMTMVPGKRTPDWQKVAMHFESKRGRPLSPIQLKINLPNADTGKFNGGIVKPVEYLGLAWDQEAEEKEVQI